MVPVTKTQVEVKTDASNKSVDVEEVSQSDSMAKLGTDDPCFLMDLPVELLDLILRKLSVKDRLNARFVSKDMDDVACCGLEFFPVLEGSTVERLNAFLEHPVRKYYRELFVGNLKNVDYSFLNPSKMELTEVLHFKTPVTYRGLPSVLWMIKQCRNLRGLDFKEYDFDAEFRLTKLNQDNEVETLCKQVTHLTVRATLFCPVPVIDISEISGVVDTADLDLPYVFNCADLAGFYSLQSLELLRMGEVYLKNLACLPITLKQLTLYTVALPRCDLILILNRLFNLTKLWIHSRPFPILGNAIEEEMERVVPLNQHIFDQMVLGTNIRFFHYTPIFARNSRRLIEANELKGSNIVEFRWTALKQDLMVRMKRQPGYRRE